MSLWLQGQVSALREWRFHLYAMIVLVGAQIWFWGYLIVGDGYLAHSDLYEYFLPVFLSPRTLWSVYEFAGFPAFADPQHTAWYPLHLFARAVGSWSFYIISAYVVASLGAYAYVYRVTRHVGVAIVAGLAWAWCEALGEKYTHVSMLHGWAWLPVLLFCLERLAAEPRGRWVVGISLAVGMEILTGHPQVAVYCLYVAGLYGLLLGFSEQCTRRFFAALAVSFALGGLLTSVQSIPLFELSTQVARTEVGFTQFADSFALTSTDLLTLVVPQVLHEGREAPTYVGALMVIGALLAWRWSGTRWRITFWAVLAVVCFLLGFGSATPLASLAYYVPFYDSFRVLARHLALFSFATIVLAGFGLAALNRGAWSTRWVLLPVGFALGLTAVVVTAVFQNIEGITITLGGFLALPLSSGSIVAVQAVIWLLTLGGVLLAARVPGTITFGCLVVLLAFDLVNSQSEPISRVGIEAPSILPAMLTRPSVHTRRLKEMIDPSFVRVLPLEGSGRDPVATGVFSRRWQIASAGGYGPLVLGRLARLARMGAQGDVQSAALLQRDRSLDLLAVQYLIVRESALNVDAVFEHEGLPWAVSDSSIPVGRQDCGYRHPGNVTLGLPTGTRVRKLALVSHLRCSEDVPQGADIGSVTVVGQDGRRHSRTLRAGIEIADAYHQMFDVTPRIRHELATVFESRDQGPDGYTATYLSRFELETEVDANYLEFSSEAMHGWLVLDRITVIDESSQHTPLALPRLALDHAARWREVRRFETSRQTDRTIDEDAPGEETFIVLENKRALPRAWMVSHVDRLSDPDVLTAVHTSVLPDGNPFDPAVTALVDENTSVTQEFLPGEKLVEMTAVTDGQLSARVSSRHGGFVVFSELWYPGWVADIDGVETSVVRANYALMGVSVPPGTHRVTLRFRPVSLIIGAGLSVATLILLIVIMVFDRRVWFMRTRR